MALWDMSLRNSVLAKKLQSVKTGFPPLNFITIHYLYFITTCLISSVIFWGASTPPRSVSYTDSLFLVISAMTEAGLNTVNLSQINTFQQVLLWLHIVIGSAIFVSSFVVLFRKKVFETRFTHIIEAEKERRRQQHHRFSISRELRRSRSMSRGQSSVERVDNSNATIAENGLSVLYGVPEIVDEDRGNSREHPTAGNQDNLPDHAHATAVDDDASVFDTETLYNPHDPTSSTIQRRHTRILTFNGVGANTHHTSFHRAAISHRPSSSRISHFESQSANHPSLDFLEDIVVGRNGQFHGLSREQREKLGGIEYRAISLLAWIVPTYLILWQLISCIGLGAYMAYNRPSVSLENGINPWWLGIFNGVSAFNNSGMSLLDANVTPFQTSAYTLCTMGLLILAGNTAYPLFLRLILWSMYKLLPSSSYFSSTKETLAFVLQYPRRVYTNLFPSTPTWWLFFSLIVLNGTDWVAFELLNLGNKKIEAIPHNYRVLDGLFQAIAVRSGGFYVVSMSDVRIGLQVLYILMMYISVYPVVITMRNSNVYEERSLGIYSDDPNMLAREEKGFANALKQRISGRAFGEENRYFLQQQLRGQLAHDLWWLMLSILIIVCIETGSFERDPVTYSVFNVAFEVVSGYGCVGISTGLPNQAYSFSGGWHTTSKLVLCAVMLRGRHRGLPVAIDRAVNLPGQPLGLREEDWELRQERPQVRTGVDTV